jgi:iron complex transport system ATP-binding protein
MSTIAVALSASALQVSLDERRVLHNLHCSFPAGRWTAIVGPNGAGKSTLLKALAGLLPYEGKVQLAGQALEALSSKTRAQRMAWLGQSDVVAQDMSVQAVAMLGRLPHQGLFAAATAQDEAAVSQALAQVDLSELRTRRVAQLSAGERQRAILARALATQANILLLDEPLAALDVPHQVQFAKLMRELTQQGVTVITVMHELHISLQADELLLMKSGRVCEQGSALEPEMHRAIERLFGESLQITPSRGIQALV